MKTILLFLSVFLSANLFGQNNHSMSFDGDDEVMVNNINLTNQSGITIQFWAKSAWNEIPTGTQNEEHLINFGSIPGIDSEYRYTIVRSGDDLLYASCEGNGFGLSGAADQSLTDNSIINNEWVNIAAVYRSNGTIELYLNGNNASLGSFTPNNNIIGLIDGNNFIGSNDGDRYLIGSMDQVSYWNTPLTQSEIQNYMNCPPTGNEAGLVGYWNFEEGSGTTAYDLTSNGNDGTINGATYVTDVPVQNCCTPNPIANQPVDQIVNIGDDANISFTDNLTGASYQWQMDSGTGFTNLSNAGQFSGSDSQSLTVSSTTMNNNNTLYRCILTESSDCQDTTDVVTLTVINNVGLSELTTTKNLIKILDMMGRETSFRPNTPLIYVYDDGSVEKVFSVEY